jgi:hypothetical protein
MNEFGTYQDASVFIRNSFDWKISRISRLEFDAYLPQLYTVGIDRFQNSFVEE